ncbi:MAG: hypothetical protein AB1428_13765 [Bacteroidota bacterium]
MSCVVREVLNRRQMRDFLQLPCRIYEGNPHWVPPLNGEIRRTLDPKRNPYFRNASLNLYVCYREGVPVARTILVISEEHCTTFNVKTGFFGFLEAYNDAEAVRSLFEFLATRCRERNIDTLEGPFNPNSYSELGLLADRYDEDPSFFQTYNPPYYHDLLAAAGFEEAEGLFTGRNPDLHAYFAAHPLDCSPRVKEGEYIVRPFSLRKFDRDLEAVREVFNDAFASNWHFLPASAEEHKFSSKYLMMVSDPVLVAIVEHRGTPVGVLLCVLDVNPLLREFHGTTGPLKYFLFRRKRKSIKTLIVFAVGIKKAYQRTRVYALLTDAMRRMARGYDVLESSWMSPSNPLSIAAAWRMGMEEYKHFKIYRKRLRVESDE